MPHRKIRFEKAQFLNLTKSVAPTLSDFRYPVHAKLICGGLKLADLLIRICDEKIGYGDYSIKEVAFLA
jgi:hypothetical protein